MASKVFKITNSNNGNNGELLAGEGKQMIAKDHSAVADNHSIIHYTDNRDAVIFGEVDELPILAEEKYFLCFSLRTALEHLEYYIFRSLKYVNSGKEE